jgi:hypothetical protein
MPCPRRTAVRWPCSFSQEHGPDPAPVNHPQGRGHPVGAVGRKCGKRGRNVRCGIMRGCGFQSDCPRSVGICRRLDDGASRRSTFARAARPPLRGGYRNQFGSEPTRPNKVDRSARRADAVVDGVTLVFAPCIAVPIGMVATWKTPDTSIRKACSASCPSKSCCTAKKWTIRTEWRHNAKGRRTGNDEERHGP